ncbi:MAG: hypothetical protein V4773_10955, partial [Verrucomicrobiota bacterium]
MALFVVAASGITLPALRAAEDAAAREAAFVQRREATFTRGLELAKKLPALPKQKWQSTTSQQPEWRRWAIPRLQVAFLQLQGGREVAAANELIVETFETLGKDTARYTGGPSGLHWSVSPILRIYFLFGPEGKLAKGRLSAKALAAMEKVLWSWVEHETRIDDADPRRAWESWASENHAAMHHGITWGATAILA